VRLKARTCLKTYGRTGPRRVDTIWSGSGCFQKPKTYGDWGRRELQCWVYMWRGTIITLQGQYWWGPGLARNMRHGRTRDRCEVYSFQRAPLASFPFIAAWHGIARHHRILGCILASQSFSDLLAYLSFVCSPLHRRAFLYLVIFVISRTSFTSTLLSSPLLFSLLFFFLVVTKSRVVAV